MELIFYGLLLLIVAKVSEPKFRRKAAGMTESTIKKIESYMIAGFLFVVLAGGFFLAGAGWHEHKTGPRLDRLRQENLELRYELEKTTESQKVTL